MLNKLDQIEILLINSKIDIMCITEHWICKNNVSNIKIPNYNIVSYFSRVNHIHGGSLIMVNSKFKTNEIPLIKQLSVEGHIEICAINCNIYNKKYGVIVAYRPPNGDVGMFIMNLTHALKIAYDMSVNVILCGDFNIDSMKKCLNTNMLHDVFDSFELNLTSSSATRIFTTTNNHTSLSCIDYMVTNLSTNLAKCETLNPNIADHLGHILSIQVNEIVPSNKNSKITLNKRCINAENIANLKFEINRVNWDEMWDLNIDDSFDFFSNTIAWCFDVSCPMKKIIIHSGRTHNYKKEWLTDELIHQGNNIKNLFWLMTNLQSSEVKTLYNAEKVKYKNNIKFAKQNFYTSKIYNASNKSKETWKIVNNKLGRNQHKEKNIVLNYNREQITDKQKIVNIFAQHFAVDASNKISEHFGSNLSLPCTTTTYREHTIFFAPITETEINEVITNLKNKKSISFDGLTATILKNINENIINQLVYLFNMSISQGHFPNILKEAIVIPVYKKGSTTEIENYRQISMLSVLSKVFERIIYNRLVSFIDKYSILTVSQHGFRSNKSTETASCHLLEYVYTMLDKSQYIVTLLFDLSKAFDTVDKAILKQKMYRVGLRGNILSWILSYMEGRIFKVRLSGVESESHDIAMGVPQGSVLGPLLFLLYVNDLPNHLSRGHLTMFADDLTVTLSARTPEELQELVSLTLEEVSAWSQRDKLILNNKKTVFINFYLQKPLPHNMQFIDDINLSNSTKLLGTYLDSKLSWDLHIEHVCSQLNKAYFGILQLKSTLDESGLLNTYYALAYSHMSYNVMCWGNAKNRDRVFICQKRILRLIFNMGYNESCRIVYKDKKILTTPCIFMLKCLCYIKKNMDLFVKRNNYHLYNTRHGDLLSIPKHLTTAFKHAPHYNCIILYNNLPQEIRMITQYNRYKNAVKRLLLEGGFYSINEFLNR